MLLLLTDDATLSAGRLVVVVVVVVVVGSICDDNVCVFTAFDGAVILGRTGLLSVIGLGAAPRPEASMGMKLTFLELFVVAFLPSPNFFSSLPFIALFGHSIYLSELSVYTSASFFWNELSTPFADGSIFTLRVPFFIDGLDGDESTA